MNIVFALIPEKGHINPYIGPAQALAARGHAVTIAAPADISAQLQAAGLPFAAELIPASPGPRPTRGPELVALIQDPPRLAHWIEQLLLSDIPPQVDQLRQLFRRLQAHIVVIDPLYYPAAIAAHLERLPWANLSNSLNPVLPPQLDSALLRTTHALSPRRAAIFAEYGMTPAFRSADILSPYLNVAFTTEALCGPVENVELVGPSFPLHARGDEVPLGDLPRARPLIYASFGSQIYHWPDIFARLREAAASIGAALVLAAGDLAPEIPATENCQVFRYAPQLAILKHANVFVTHGGANSFMESIAAGVPMLLSPMCNDQFHQAYFLERASLGQVQDLRNSPADQIAAALTQILAGTRMPELSKTYQQNGAPRAAALVEALRP